MNKAFWTGKRVLLTGHTGFKGGWMAVWLQSLGAKVCGVSDARVSDPDFYSACEISALLDCEVMADIRDLASMRKVMADFMPEIVIHMAAQPIVLRSITHPAETFAVNVVGTCNVLQAAQEVGSAKAILNITTDKVYLNREWIWSYRENDALGGKDPYSSSKSCADLAARSFYLTYFRDSGVGMANVRAGNVIGGGDWAADRLVPDFFRALDMDKSLKIRNPDSVRPWQHVLEPISGYLSLAEALWIKPELRSGDWNFGPSEDDCMPVMWMIKHLVSKAPKKVDIQIDQVENNKEARLLKLDSAKAKAELGWAGKLQVQEALDFCLDWHAGWHAGRAQEVTRSQIEAYNGWT